MMQVDRMIGGRKCSFRICIYPGRDLPQKRIDVFCEGGLSSATNWLQAMAFAREMAGYADARDATAIANAIDQEASRSARVEKHQAKQKRRAAGRGRS